MEGFIALLSLISTNPTIAAILGSVVLLVLGWIFYNKSAKDKIRTDKKLELLINLQGIRHDWRSKECLSFLNQIPTIYSDSDAVLLAYKELHLASFPCPSVVYVQGEYTTEGKLNSFNKTYSAKLDTDTRIYINRLFIEMAVDCKWMNRLEAVKTDFLDSNFRGLN